MAPFKLPDPQEDMALSAFDDKSQEPGSEEVAEVLGEAACLWDQLTAVMRARFEPLAEDWVYSGKKWGWALRLKRKNRAVLYMTPSDQFFYVGFALGRKAVDAAHESALPSSVLTAIDQAPKYAEGRAVRLEVRSAADLDNIEQLARIKMAN